MQSTANYGDNEFLMTKFTLCSLKNVPVNAVYVMKRAH